LFCPKCGMLKSRCRCKVETKRQKNLKLCPKEELKSLFDTEDEIVLYKLFEPYKSEPDVPLKDIDLSDRVKKALKLRNIKKLYPFQAKAVDLVKSRENVVITAPTGFGKTEAFILPVIDVLKEGEKALVIYPTKALARDQYRKISYYASFAGLRTVKFDGDSTLSERRAVFSGRADVVLTNPDMVDYHLRNTGAFRNFLKNVRFIVVDEFHTYSGILGTSMHYKSGGVCRRTVRKKVQVGEWKAQKSKNALYNEVDAVHIFLNCRNSFGFEGTQGNCVRKLLQIRGNGCLGTQAKWDYC